MHVSLIGVNHETAPIGVREKVAIKTEKLPDSLSLLRRHVPQGIILSTCNRTEVYTIDPDHGGDSGFEFFQAHINTPEVDWQQYFYVSTDKAAVEHLFRVACGLESMVVGEYEVLGQVKQALETAEKAGMVNLPLRHIFNSAIRAGRRVREETGISKNALSASSVAVDLATKVVGNLRQSKILVIGAGEAGRLVVKVARERGVSQLVVASRTWERASALAAELGGTPIDSSSLLDELGTSNIVVTCSGAPHWILSAHHVAEAMGKRPDLPLVIIDISVPRDVEPAAGQIANVFLYNIDDLTSICQGNRKQREGEVEQATGIIEAELEKFVSWWQAIEARPVVSALMNKAEEIRTTQLERTLKKLRGLSDEERESVDAMTKSIITRILKDPIQYLKASNGDNEDYAAIIAKLFRLDEADQK